MIQTKLFVDENNKVVVCRVYEVLDKWTDDNGKKHLYTRPLTSAKVTCKEEDEFDLKKGKQMAYARAMVKASDKFIRRTVQTKKQLEKQLKLCEEEITHNTDVKDYYDNEYQELAK